MENENYSFKNRITMENGEPVTPRHLQISNDVTEINTIAPAALQMSDDESEFKTVTPRTLVSNDKSEYENSLTIILVGKSKSGISTIAKMFNKYKNFTMEPYQNKNLAGDRSTGFINNRRTTLVDIPGLFGIDDEEHDAKEVLQSYTRSIATEIILFVVIRVASLTQFDIKVFNLIRDLISNKNISQIIVIFTCNESDAEGFSVENFIHQSRKLSAFISSNNCKPCMFTVSRKKESENAQKLFSTVDSLIAKPNSESENTTIMNDSNDNVDQRKVNQMAVRTQSIHPTPKLTTQHRVWVPKVEPYNRDNIRKFEILEDVDSLKLRYSVPLIFIHECKFEMRVNVYEKANKRQRSRRYSTKESSLNELIFTKLKTWNENRGKKKQTVVLFAPYYEDNYRLQKVSSVF